MKNFTFILLLFINTSVFSQNTVSGTVIDSFRQPIPGVKVQIKDGKEMILTDFDGGFSLTTNQEFPITLEISSIGFETKEVDVTSSEKITIVLEEINFLDELVISASRTPERLFESPVTIERYGIKEIKNVASPDFYDGLGNLKGVDFNTNSLVLKSINTRGFATYANTRFVQLIDGMDNTVAALNFVLGNLAGVSELDINNIELLPGASSALYGANAFNGILFMNTKNPFDYQGISAYTKGGITSQDAAGENQFIDYGIRIAHAFSDKFAAKINFSYISGTDWLAQDEQDLARPGATRSNPGYDGLNIYGDEIGENLNVIGQNLVRLNILTQSEADKLPNTFVSRTGYKESDLNSNDVESLKFDAAIHYRPFADDLEVIYLAKVNRGTAITQDANRSLLDNFQFQQHKLEIRNDNFFARGYLAESDSGDSYDVRFTGININNTWKDNQTWFAQYAGAYLQTFNLNSNQEQSHIAARIFANEGRLIPGTSEFQEAFDTVISNPDLTEGSKIQEQSLFRHFDGNYNFTHLTKSIADVQIGGSFREYKLKSGGTVYTDIDGPIVYSEFGIYTQLQKKIMDDRLKLTGSIRYDKSQLFDGNYSPRVAIGYTLGSKRNHNVRASIQSGFRNPTTQDLYIGLDSGPLSLVGSAADNLDRYTFDVSGTTLTARDAYENSFSATSVREFAATGDQSRLVVSNPDIVKPEKILSYEIGYRGQLNTINIDANVYYNQYKDFISNKNVIVPTFGDVDGTGQDFIDAVTAIQSNTSRRVFSASTNSDADISSYGTSIGITTSIKGFELGGNYTYAKQIFEQGKDPDFRSSFNTPNHKIKLSFGKSEILKNLGFNAHFLWSDNYFWEAEFGNGPIPAYKVLDAQLTYKLPITKLKIKLGGNNILGEDYFTGIGSGFIGSQYYLSLSINDF